MSLAVTHIAFDLGLRHQRRHRIDDDDVKSPGTNEHVGDFQRLLPVVRLRNDERIGIDAQVARIHGIKGVLGVDERGHATVLLRVGDHMQRQRGLARRLRAIDLHNASTGQTADAQSSVEGQRTGGNHLDVLFRPISQTHGRALAELLLHLGQRRIERILALLVDARRLGLLRLLDGGLASCSHLYSSLQQSNAP